MENNLKEQLCEGSVIVSAPLTSKVPDAYLGYSYAILQGIQLG